MKDRRWLILAVVGIAQLMVVLDATIVNIALPSAQADLGFSDDARQWVVTAYALAFGSLLLLGGRLSDLFGRKRAFLAGAAGFAGASALGGAAGSFAMLVTARAIQGGFAALLAPAALSIVSGTFTDPRERGKAFGIYGAIAGGGGAVGLLLGGILTEYTSWRACMYVNLGFALPAALAGFALLGHGAAAARPRIDLPGVLTASSGLFCLVFGFSKAETAGWGATITLSCLAAGAVLLAAFVLVERRAKHPLLPLRVVLDRNRGGAYLAVASCGAGMFGVFLFLTYYLQQTLGFSPVQAGAAFLPMTACLVLAAGVAGRRLVPRTGPKPVIAAGMLLAATGMVMITGLGVDSSYAPDVLPSLCVFGLGMGLTMSTAMGTATLGVRPEDAGVASAMVNTGQQVGGSIGTAVLSTLAATAATDSLHAHPDRLAQAAVHGYTTAFWISAGIFAAGALLAGALVRPGVPVADPDAPPAFAH
jgi:EmrB/QacA subfamily drug resistance transporter